MSVIILGIVNHDPVILIDAVIFGIIDFMTYYNWRKM
jgi:hypothetical protein